jgi:hypothetical protein
MYDICEHKHSFAAWAAARAASWRPCRFSVKQGRELIESLRLGQQSLRDLNQSPDKLPAPEDFDGCHYRWRSQILFRSEKMALKGMTHGVAAKLINVYWKSMFVCGGEQDHPTVKVIHPPIDSLLLNGLAAHPNTRAKADWKSFHPWTGLSSARYEELIRKIRSAIPEGAPLWKIEEYWPGYR